VAASGIRLVRKVIRRDGRCTQGTEMLRDVRQRQAEHRDRCVDRYAMGDWAEGEQVTEGASDGYCEGMPNARLEVIARRRYLKRYICSRDVEGDAPVHLRDGCCLGTEGMAGCWDCGDISSADRADQGRMFGYMGLWVWVGIGPTMGDGLVVQGTTWVISSWVATTRGGCGVQQAAVRRRTRRRCQVKWC
jgi:hypothetical protein